MANLTQPSHQAIAPHASAWVGANAGSGKTYILVSRLVRLMLDGVAPEKLLCLTYTRAAAAEMQERLFALLAQWALTDDADLRQEIAERLGIKVDEAQLSRARALFARALETPGGLRVQTIHAFCESLLKRFPLEAGLSPQFELLDEQDADDIQAALIARLVAAPPTSKRMGEDSSESDGLPAAMARLTRVLNEADLHMLGRLIIAKRQFWQIDGASQLRGLAQHLRIEEPVPSAELLIGGLLQAHAKSLPALADWLAAGSAQDQSKAADIGAALSALRQDQPLTAWQHLQAVFLTQTGAPRKKMVTQKTAAAAPALFEQLSALADEVLALAERLKAISTYQMTAAVQLFAARLLAGYEAEKRRRAVLDYDDLIAATNHLLSGANAAQWVLFKIDRGLEHILVDEAQDTSPAQWRVIRALADEFFNDDTQRDRPRTLFAVGDEKQSIFSFQGADPTEFAKQRAHFEAAVGRFDGAFYYVPMQQSRRSAPQVLQLVDRVFATPAMCDGVTADGQPMQHTAFRDMAIGHVECWPVDKTVQAEDELPLWAVPEQTASQDGRSLLAARIGDKIAALLADKAQNITAGDMLILVRKRDGFVEEMSRALKQRGIAVAGADRMVLLEQAAIMDVLAALDVALNPLDDMALAIVLRSPLGGLSEEQLFALAYQRPADLWQAFCAAAQADDAAPELAAAHKRLVWLHDKAHVLPPYELLAQFLGAQGGHKLLSARLGAEIDDPIGELLRLALAYEARHAASLQGFIHWLQQGQQEIKRDMESAGGAVRIMTVHGAKGLEAPIVFLPDTCRPPVKQGGASDRMQFTDDKLPLWRAGKMLRDSFSEAQVARDNALTSQEERRLLYVALTRARDRLYIGGWLGKRDKNPALGSWYQLIAEALAGQEGAVAAELAAGETALEKSQAETADKMPPSPPPAAPDWLHQRPPAEAKPHYYGDKLFSPSALGDDSPPRALVAQGAPGDQLAQAEALQQAAERGTLVHKLLQTLPSLPEAARRQAADDYLARLADSRQPPLSAEACAAMVDEALRIIALPVLADLFSAAARAEVPLAGVLLRDDGQKLALSGQIDRLLVTPEAVHIVDFKTGTPHDSPPPRYVVQMAAYQALLAQLYPDRPVRCSLVWTQTGRVDDLPQNALQAALADLLAGQLRLP